MQDAGFRTSWSFPVEDTPLALNVSQESRVAVPSRDCVSEPPVVLYCRFQLAYRLSLFSPLKAEVLLNLVITRRLFRWIMIN